MPRQAACWIMGLVGLCTGGLGCGPVTLATRTLFLEPLHYCASTDAVWERHRDYQLADAAWESVASADSSHAYSPDYVTGFKDGFADYLFAGGTGEPPPLPPRYYWKIHYETPQGHAAIQDWFAGFRLGAAVARESGYRQWITVPTAAPPLTPPHSVATPESGESPAAPPAETQLPAPRKVLPPQ